MIIEFSSANDEGMCGGIVEALVGCGKQMAKSVVQQAI
jgi:hypothetical protein